MDIDTYINTNRPFYLYQYLSIDIDKYIYISIDPSIYREVDASARGVAVGDTRR